MVVPGMVDADGKVLYAPQLGWRQVSIREALEEGTGLPVQIENASTACALAHMWLVRRAGDSAADFVYVNVSDGVGVGIVMNGQLVRGHGQTAGEFGHIPIDPRGPACVCGSTGCWEAFTSNIATLARYHGREPSARVVAQRNSHASLVDGLVLSGGIPAFVAPEYDPDLGMAHGVTPQALAELRRSQVLGAQVDDGDVIVLLERHHRFVARVDVDKLRLRVLRRVARQSGERHVRPRPAERVRPRQVDNDEVPGWIAEGRLRQAARHAASVLAPVLGGFGPGHVVLVVLDVVFDRGLLFLVAWDGRPGWAGTAAPRLPPRRNRARRSTAPSNRRPDAMSSRKPDILTRRARKPTLPAWRPASPVPPDFFLPLWRDSHD